MATMRDTPYGNFNFMVDLGDGSEGFRAGFQEISAISASIDVIEYRNGNDRGNAPRKIPGLSKVADVTLRRGVIGSLALFQWLAQIRDGDQGAVRTVTISLLNEAHEIVLSWRLLRARIVKYVSGPLNARGGDVAMEELVLAYERLEME